MNIREVMHHGNRRFRVDFGKSLDGRRRVRIFETESEAERAVEKAKRDARAIGKQWANLPAERRLEVVSILNEMSAAGLSLRAVWEAFRTQQMRPVEEAKRRSLSAAISELVRAKQASKKRESYIESLEGYLIQFARGREAAAVDRITPADIEAWFAARNEADSTRASNMGRLSSLFGFCVRRGYCKANPCDALEKISLETKPPKILSLRQTARALISTLREKPQYLAWLVLALPCGMRPEEAMNTNRSDINLDFQWGTQGQIGIVRVDASATKVRDRRIIHLNPAQHAWLWLALRLKPSLPMNPSSKKRFLKWLRAKLGFSKWPQDILRHTSASYQLAHHQDAGKVARELGNSAGILLRRYTELVERPHAAKFVNLRPSKRMLKALR